MADLQSLFESVNQLNVNELDELQRYIANRKKLTWWVVPPENLRRIDEIMHPVQQEAENFSEAEINALIDDVIGEVRREEDDTD